jgi:hypothetical protein
VLDFQVTGRPSEVGHLPICSTFDEKFSFLRKQH